MVMRNHTYLIMPKNDGRSIFSNENLIDFLVRASELCGQTTYAVFDARMCLLYEYQHPCFIREFHPFRIINEYLPTQLDICSHECRPAHNPPLKYPLREADT